MSMKSQKGKRRVFESLNDTADVPGPFPIYRVLPAANNHHGSCTLQFSFLVFLPPGGHGQKERN